jgi:hypothetical protein
MVSLAEVLDVGDVTWSGYSNKTNDFAVKLKIPPESLSKFVRNKVGYLRMHWYRLLQNNPSDAWAKWTSVVKYIVINSDLDVKKHTKFSTQFKDNSHHPEYIN